MEVGASLYWYKSVLWYLIFSMNIKNCIFLFPAELWIRIHFMWIRIQQFF